MLNIIKKTIFIFILIIVFSYPISFYISNHFNTFNKQNWILNLKGLNLDYAVIGSSRVYNIIDIKSMDSTFGKKGINLGTSGSAFSENFIILSEFILKNKISTLILNVDEFGFDSENNYSYPFHEFEFLPLTNRYADVFSDYIPEWKLKLWKITPIIKYIEYNGQYNFYNKPMTHNNMGSCLFNETIKKNKFITIPPQGKIKKIDEKYFLKIINLCKEKNIKLILITTPILTNYNNTIFIDFINKIINKYNLKYYNFENLLEKNEAYFNDNTHTNIKGSMIYSLNLGRKLKTDNN